MRTTWSGGRLVQRGGANRSAQLRKLEESAADASAPVDQVTALQRTAGNRAVVRLLVHGEGPGGLVVQRQPKLPKVDPKAEDARILKAMKANFTYAFWSLPEAKGVRPGSSGDATFIVNGVAVRILPDRYLTEPEYVAAGGSFKDGNRDSAAETSWNYDGVDWDPKSVQATAMAGTGQYMIDDYIEPVAKLRIQTTYQKKRGGASLKAARGVRSGYGKGLLLQDHEASHVKDAIDYIRSNGPRLPDGRGSESNAFNASVKAYLQAARDLGGSISTYSRAKTDCPGTRNAAFCAPIVKKK